MKHVSLSTNYDDMEGYFDISISDKDRKAMERSYRLSKLLVKELLNRANNGEVGAAEVLKNKFGVIIHKNVK